LYNAKNLTKIWKSQKAASSQKAAFSFVQNFSNPILAKSFKLISF